MYFLLIKNIIQQLHRLQWNAQKATALSTVMHKKCCKLYVQIISKNTVCTVQVCSVHQSELKYCINATHTSAPSCCWCSCNTQTGSSMVTCITSPSSKYWSKWSSQVLLSTQWARTIFFVRSSCHFSSGDSSIYLLVSWWPSPQLLSHCLIWHCSSVDVGYLKKALSAKLSKGMQDLQLSSVMATSWPQTLTVCWLRKKCPLLTISSLQTWLFQHSCSVYTPGVADTHIPGQTLSINNSLWYDGMPSFSIVRITRVQFWCHHGNVAAVYCCNTLRCSPSVVKKVAISINFLASGVWICSESSTCSRSPAHSGKQSQHKSQKVNSHSRSHCWWLPPVQWQSYLLVHINGRCH